MFFPLGVHCSKRFLQHLVISLDLARSKVDSAQQRLVIRVLDWVSMLMPPSVPCGMLAFHLRIVTGPPPHTHRLSEIVTFFFRLCASLYDELAVSLSGSLPRGGGADAAHCFPFRLPSSHCPFVDRRASGGLAPVVRV